MRLLRLLLIASCVGTAVAACGTPADAPQASVATPAPTAITPFAGYWEGATSTGTDVERAATVLIEEGPAGEFTVTWRNIAAADATDAAEPVTMRDATMTFRPGDDASTWDRVADADPAGDERQAWAVLEAPDMLVIHIQAMTPAGEVEHQTYSRRVAGDEMALEYIRRINNVPTRVIRGSFIRTAGA